MVYEERHVIRYDTQQLSPDRVNGALRDLNLNPTFHSAGNIVLSIPQERSELVATLTKQFGKLLDIKEEALPII